MSSLVISLDLELFWGVAASRSIAGYRNNIEGEWTAVPRILALFRCHEVRATWAVVGMAMCRDYAQWRELRPSVLPTYLRGECSTYGLDAVAREFPTLFFARPLVERILATPGQEVGTHTYSHFYCAEEGVTTEQFGADLACAKEIGRDMQMQYRSLVFPRNQILQEFIRVSAQSGIGTYRGNPDHWLYRGGSRVPGGASGRAVRFADSWLPISGACTARCKAADGAVNVPASLFLRPWARRLAAFEPLRLARMKQAMTMAACSGGICHLWWHPHNFGVNLEQNLAVLESLLLHYRRLREQYGMRSMEMSAPELHEAA